MKENQQKESTIENIMKGLGLVIGIIGIVLTFTGVGAIAGVPMITIALFLVRLGRVFGKFPKASFIAICCIVLFIILVFNIDNIVNVFEDHKYDNEYIKAERGNNNASVEEYVEEVEEYLKDDYGNWTFYFQEENKEIHRYNNITKVDEIVLKYAGDVKLLYISGSNLWRWVLENDKIDNQKYRKELYDIEEKQSYELFKDVDYITKVENKLLTLDSVVFKVIDDYIYCYYGYFNYNGKYIKLTRINTNNNVEEEISTLINYEDKESIDSIKGDNLLKLHDTLNEYYQQEDSANINSNSSSNARDREQKYTEQWAENNVDFIRDGKLRVKKDCNGGDVGGIRVGKHETFERVVFDIYSFVLGGKGEKIDESGTYEVEVSSLNNSCEIRFIARNKTAEIPKVDYDLIKNIESMQILDDSEVGIRINFKKDVEVRVYDLKNPGRVVVDVREINQ
ncbi:O-antigen ligase family protein [Vallitalea guaymasensis]|uniref:AMIN-like domain-containing (lipo)protein n=1 Tax=Vallitalea guaymasensis TaxID=1185412 RepID=UPI000DE49480|nr:O-antigen ligase family protein [Vallitalea guaymasensis]